MKIHLIHTFSDAGGSLWIALREDGIRIGSGSTKQRAIDAVEAKGMKVNVAVGYPGKMLRSEAAMTIADLKVKAQQAKTAEIDKAKEMFRQVVDKIHDAEAAHALEDDLWEFALRAIAGGSKQAVELAQEALRTKQLDFPRYKA